LQEPLRFERNSDFARYIKKKRTFLLAVALNWLDEFFCWLDEFCGWVRVIMTVVGGPVLVILGLASGHWGYAIFGALVSISGAFVAKWIS